jgi:hypothetical protein
MPVVTGDNQARSGPVDGGARASRSATPLPLGVSPSPAADLPRWVYWLGLAVLTAAGAAERVAWLNHPMRYDESWTFLFYIMPRTLSAALVYSAPNNHILHTLLVAAASWLWGDSPAALRIPALLAGIALIPATAYLARVLSGRRVAGLVAATFVAASSLLVEYSVNARGYTMFCLAAVLMAERTARIVRDARPRWPWVGWVLLAAGGLITIPVMIYPIIILAIVVLIQALVGSGGPAARYLAVRRAVLAVLASGVLGFLLYLPVFHATGMVATEDDPAARASVLRVYASGLYAVVANPTMSPKPFPQAAAALPHVAAETMIDWSRDAWWVWPGLVLVGLAAATVVGLRQRRMLYLVPLVAAGVLPALALAQSIVPFSRLWLFALPLVLAVASCGLAELAGRATRGRARRLAVAGVVLAVLAVNADAGRQLFRPGRRVIGECALIDARAIVSDALDHANGRTGLAWDFGKPTWPLLGYYTATLSTPARHFVDYLDDGCRRVLVVVPTSETLADVLADRRQLAAAYGAMSLWRRYPSADVYIAPRKVQASSRPPP